MKFGGASVAHPENFDKVSDIIENKSKSYDHIVVVVSAMGDTTNNLIELAHKVHEQPPKRELDMLISVGERISISLLAMALSKRGVGAISFTGSQSGIITSEDHSEAKIIDVKPKRILSELEKKKVVIVAGFQGVSSLGEITTLGRGGSDTTAVALGVALEAEKVEFYKDVLGVYTEDPKKNSQAVLYSSLGFDEALDIMKAGAKVLHARAVALAKVNCLPLHVVSFNKVEEGGLGGTLIGSLENRSLLYKKIYEKGLNFFGGRRV